MGVNICVYRVRGNDSDRVATEEWDLFANGGAREFGQYLSSDEYGVFEYTFNKEEEIGFYRPVNFADIRAWVMQHMREGNKSMYLAMLNRMEQDEQLQFYISW